MNPFPLLTVRNRQADMSNSGSDPDRAPDLMAVGPHHTNSDTGNGNSIGNDNLVSRSESMPKPHPFDTSAALEDAVDARSTVDDHNGDLITDAEVNHLKRGLAERHLSMLGIAGAIGTGLFLSLGGAIQTGGPLGALLGYAMVGGIVCSVQFALGEVTALLPVR